MFDKFSLLVNLGDESGGVQTILFLITSQVNSTIEALVFIIQTSDRICSFLPYLNL